MLCCCQRYHYCSKIWGITVLILVNEALHRNKVLLWGLSNIYFIFYLKIQKSCLVKANLHKNLLKNLNKK